MKYTAIILAAAGLAAAQSLSQIPACAQSCITSAVQNATTCSVTDYKCICNNENALVGAATSCVINACGATVATNQVLPATEQFCSEVLAGGTVSGSSTASASASSSAGSSVASSAATTTSAASSSAAASTTSSPTTSAASNSSSTTTSASVSAVVTAGAAIAGSVGSFAMLALGALAAF